jgi:hypothetical protein
MKNKNKNEETVFLDAEEREEALHMYAYKKINVGGRQNWTSAGSLQSTLN